MSSIFVSYSRSDEAFARKLGRALSDAGLDVWIDVEDIPAGMKWSSAIQHGLDNANLMIVIISPTSMESRNVEDEWQYYLDNNKPIIPVLLEPAKIHFQLARIQYIDFHRQDFDSAYNRLVVELRSKGINISAPQQPIAPQPVSSHPPHPVEVPVSTSPTPSYRPPPAVNISAPPFDVSGEPMYRTASAKRGGLNYLMIGGAIAVVAVIISVAIILLSGRGGNPCPGLPDSLFKAGDQMRIATTQSQFLFSNHDIDSQRVATIDRNTRIVVFGEPFCGTSSIWWPVQIGNLAGWMAENFNETRLLEAW